MSTSKYHTSNTDKFFKVVSSIVENEINSSVTVTMINLVNLSKINQIRKSMQDNKPSYTVFVAKALAMALKEFPEMNKRFYRPLGFLPSVYQIFKTVDIAIASEVVDKNFSHVAYIDVMTDVQDKSLQDIQQWLLDFRNTNSVKQWAMFSQTITKLPVLISRLLLTLPIYLPKLWVKYRGGAAIISSPAKYGVDSLIATWSAPIGISFGHVKDRPLVEQGSIIVASSFYLTLNFDRRLFSGAQGARFIARICEILESGCFN